MLAGVGFRGRTAGWGVLESSALRFEARVAEIKGSLSEDRELLAVEFLMIGLWF